MTLFTLIDIPAPPLLKLNEDLRRIEALEEENKRLKDQVSMLLAKMVLAIHV